MGRYKQPFTLFKRGKFYYYRTYNKNGVRTTAHSTGQTTKTNAMNYCNNLFLTNSLYVENITFKEFATGFFDKDSIYIRDKTKPLKENTRASYAQALKLHLLPALQNFKLADITYSMLKEVRQSMIDKGLSSNTINYNFIVLGVIMRTAYLDELIQKNPCEYLGSLPRDNNVRDSFSKEEIRTMYQRINPEQKKMFLLLVLTGMRLSEGIGVLPEDVKEINGNYYIHLYRQKQRKEYTSLKNDRPRDIPIIPEIIPLITEYGFISMTFYKWCKIEVDKCQNAAERKLCVHSLRHFFITDSKSYGVNPLKVETIAGHSLKGIQQIYTNFKIDDLTDIYEWQKKTFDYITKS